MPEGACQGASTGFTRPYNPWMRVIHKYDHRVAASTVAGGWLLYKLFLQKSAPKVKCVGKVTQVHNLFFERQYFLNQ